MAVALLLGLHTAGAHSREGARYGHMAAAYRDARAALAEEEAAERGYLLDRDATDRAETGAAAARVVAALHRIPAHVAAKPQHDHAAYATAVQQAFAAL